MLNIHSLRWDGEILDWLDVPEAMLPELVDNSGVVGSTDPRSFHGDEAAPPSQVPDQPGVGGPEEGPPPLRHLPGPLHAVQDPPELSG